MTPRKLEHGELTRIVIGTVVASEGIRAAALTKKLNAQGIMVTKHQMSVRLGELARDGRIERLSRGLYEGV